MDQPTIAASEFKAKCLKILDQVASEGASVVVTKHGKPVARVVPHHSKLPPLKGSWAAHCKITGDIVSPAIPEEDWLEAEQEWDEFFPPEVKR